MQCYAGIWWKEAVERSTTLNKSSHYSISIDEVAVCESHNYVGKKRNGVVGDSEFMNLRCSTDCKQRGALEFAW